jgi:hypothetical protein
MNGNQNRNNYSCISSEYLGFGTNSGGVGFIGPSKDKNGAGSSEVLHCKLQITERLQFRSSEEEGQESL